MILGHAEHTRQLFVQLRQFEIDGEQKNAGATRIAQAISADQANKISQQKTQAHGLAMQLINAWQVGFETLTPFLGYFNPRTHVVESQLSDTKSQLEKATATISKAEDLLESLRDENKSLAITAHKTWFDVAAKLHDGRAKLWLIGAALTIAVAACLFNKYISEPAFTPADVNDLISHFLPKVGALGFLVTLLYFCMKNYAAASHNFIVNKHRANVLETFEVIRDATDDTRFRDELTERGLEVIFDHQDSGYSKFEVPLPNLQMPSSGSH
jgi:hypothetical protein